MITRTITQEFTIPANCEWERVDNADGSITIKTKRIEFVKPTESVNRRWTEQLLSQVLNEYESGTTVKQLSVKYDVSPSRISDVIRRAQRAAIRGEI